MLSWNKVLRYINLNLALPSTFIEHSEEDMRQNLIDFTIPEFSQYYPDKEFAPIITTNNTYKHPTLKNHYIIHDDEELEIYGICKVYFPAEGHLTAGHPVMGAMSFEGMKWWSLETFKSSFFMPYSNWSYTYQFIAPCYLKINNEMQPGGNLAVEYERCHPSDLRKIPGSLHRRFMDLCLADTKVWIGQLRSHYGDGRLNTPYGEIPLSGDRLLQEGKEERERLISEFSDDYKISGFYIDIG
jgi:hypothetical protein